MSSLPKGWIETKLGQVVEIVNGGTPSTKNKNYWNGDISWITPKDLSNFEGRYILKGEKSITQQGLDNSSAKLLPINTILFSSRAPIGYVAIAKQEVSTNQGFKNIVCDEVNTHYLYMYYWLKINAKHVEKLSSGSTFSEASTSLMKSLNIKLPKIDEQKTIANILSSFDKKIELLKEQNQTLETMAGAIFKESIQNKDNLKETTLGELVNIKYGKDHKHLEDGDYPLYGSGGIMRYVEKPLYEKESILIPRKGTLGNLFFAQEPFWSVDTIFYTEIDETKIFPIYLYYQLKRFDLANLNVGSAVPSLTTKVLNSVKLNIPNIKNQKETVDNLKVLNKKVLSNISQIETLSKTRDSLLPKLMNGEVRVEI